MKVMPEIDTETRQDTQALRTVGEIVSAASLLFGKIHHSLTLFQNPRWQNILRNGRQFHALSPGATEWS